MKYLLKTLVICLLITSSCKTTKLNNANEKGKLLLEGIEFTASMKLIGMNAYYDPNNTFENYNFYIDKVEDLISVSKELKLGSCIPNRSTENEFTIMLLDGDKILKKFSINPDYPYIRTKGKTYYIDNSLLKKISKKYTFKYTFESIKFDNSQEFDEFYKTVINESDYIFLYKPNFKHEGKFEIEFPKTNKFSSPSAIMKYLDPKLKVISRGESFHLYYRLTDYNFNNLNQYSITVESDYKLYSEFKCKDGVVKEWTSNVYTATIFSKEQ